jgi:hypothetical protein
MSPTSVKCFTTAQFPSIAGDKDRVEPYALFANNHDGSRASVHAAMENTQWTS